MASVKIEKHNGAPTLIIDGKTYPPMGYFMEWKDPENHLEHIRMRYDAGQRMFYIGWYLGDWVEPGSSALLLKNCQTVLDALPDDVYLGVVIELTPPRTWIESHPDDLIKFSDGTSHPMRLLTSLEYNELVPGMYSICSENFRHDAGEELSHMLDKLDSAPFAEKIVSVVIAGGGTREWYYPNSNAFINKQTGEVADYSEAFRKNYEEFLRKKYGTTEELRRVWNDPEATFEHPKIPTFEERSHINIDEAIQYAMKNYENYNREINDSINMDGDTGFNLGVFLKVNRHQHVCDFYQAIGYGTAQTLSYFGSIVKSRSIPRLMITFYGIVAGCNYYNFGTCSATMELLDSGNVDMLCTAATYYNREPGGYLTHRIIQDSFLLRNVMFANEGDSRTHWIEPFYRDLFRLYDANATINTFKREFAQQICDNLQGWWYDMDRPGFVKDGMRDLLARMKELAVFEHRQDRRKMHDIALIYDLESIHCVSEETDRLILESYRCTDLGRIGTPVDLYFHNDVLHPEMPDYKMYVMINVFCLTDEEREAIKIKARRNNALVLWLYAPGFINLKADRIMDNANIEATVGMSIDRIDQTIAPRYRIEEKGHPALAMADPDRYYGFLDRGLHSNIWPNGDLVAPAFANPFFYIKEQEGITVLGRYCLDQKIALAMKNDHGYTSVYCATQVVRSDLLRSFAAYAGVHLYTHGDDFISANQTFVSIHAKDSGKKTLYFKEPCSPFEVYQKKFYGQNITQLELDMRMGETLTFSIQGAC